MFDKAKANFSQGNAPAKPVDQLIQGYIAVYEQWRTAQPKAGRDAKADVWRKTLDTLNKGGTQPAAALL